MIPIDLTGKRALVCGSTQGIGRAIATAFASAGASVILAARNEGALKRVVSDLPPMSKEPHSYICADFSRRDFVEQAVRIYLETQGNPPIHILVNNTGGPATGQMLDASDVAFLDAFSQHLLVNQMLVQLLAEGMKRERYGRIINVISTSVKQPIPNLGVSNTIRGSVNSWAKTLSFELAPFGITVNNILPGYIRTGRLESLALSIAQASGKAVLEVEADMLRVIPAGRFGEPTELGQAAAFLASPLAAYITGIGLAIDGGRTTAL
jgi:3-oxoacyl-[acyl-carrier protein] reductase